MFLTFFYDKQNGECSSDDDRGRRGQCLGVHRKYFFILKTRKNNDAEAERERHDKAVEQLEAAQAAWSQKRTQRLDLINEEIQKEHHAEQTFDNVDQALKQYYYITGKQLDPLPPEPKLSDYYAPSPDQQNRELLFIVAGMAATGFFCL